MVSTRPRRILPLLASFVIATLVIVAVLVASQQVSVTGSKESSSATSISGSSSVTGANASSAAKLDSSFVSHMVALASRNLSGIVSQYEPNDTVTWTGNTVGLAGLYVGTANLRILLGSFFGTNESSFTIGNLTDRILAVSPSSATVNSTFSFSGHNNQWGNYSGSISAQDVFVYSGASDDWLICQEIWNFLRLQMQYPMGFVACTGPSCSEFVQSMAFSADGTYLAAGTYENSGYGAVYLVSIQGQSPRLAWRSVTTNTVIWSVAVSSNGSYVAAAGFARPGDPHGNGRVYLFNREGALLWNVSAGSEPRAVWVAIAANGSRVAADYGSGIICVDNSGRVLWNYTFPQGGMSYSFAMSSNAGQIAYAEENITLGGHPGPAWGVFALSSQGRPLWNFMEDHSGGDHALVQMSASGSAVAALSQLSNNGTLYYLDGVSGRVLWSYPLASESGIANFDSLVMSPDGSYVVAGGPSTGIQLVQADGKVVWAGSPAGFGEPALVIENDSLMVTFSLISDQYELVAFNGTVIGQSGINSVSEFASSPSGSTWVAADGGLITSTSCTSLEFYNGTIPLPSAQLCR